MTVSGTIMLIIFFAVFARKFGTKTGLGEVVQSINDIIDGTEEAGGPPSAKAASVPADTASSKALTDLKLRSSKDLLRSWGAQ